MFCYVMFCYVVLCCVMLCNVMLRYLLLCYVMLRCVMLCLDPGESRAKGRGQISCGASIFAIFIGYFFLLIWHCFTLSPKTGSIFFQDIQYYVMLCYVILSCVLLCHVMLSFIMLCYFMLCYVVLCCVLIQETAEPKAAPVAAVVPASWFFSWSPFSCDLAFAIHYHILSPKTGLIF